MSNGEISSVHAQVDSSKIANTSDSSRFLKIDDLSIVFTDGPHERLYVRISRGEKELLKLSVVKFAPFHVSFRTGTDESLTRSEISSVFNALENEINFTNRPIIDFRDKPGLGYRLDIFDEVCIIHSVGTDI
ncbi:MAG: hypothetical protein EOP06_09665 [Proteobacteria bacterium]|nr:MAG: hypothetical protein EOP06_09665 [Pseudomonadota bacterium]